MERKTKKYYRSKLNNFDTGCAVIKEIVQKYGTSTRRGYYYISNLKPEFNWNHRISGFTLSKGILYVDIYWQGDSTDGETFVEFSELIAGLRYTGKYTIAANYDYVGGDEQYYCRHSEITIEKQELLNAFSQIALRLKSKQTMQ